MRVDRFFKLSIGLFLVFSMLFVGVFGGGKITVQQNINQQEMNSPTITKGYVIKFGPSIEIGGERIYGWKIDNENDLKDFLNLDNKVLTMVSQEDKKLVETSTSAYLEYIGDTGIDASNTRYKFLRDLNVEPSIQTKKTTIENVAKLQSELEELKSNPDKNKDDIKNKESQLKTSISISKDLMDYDTLMTLNKETRDIILGGVNNENCEGFSLCQIGKLFGEKNKLDIYVTNKWNDIINDVKTKCSSGCSTEDYNNNLEEGYDNLIYDLGLSCTDVLICQELIDNGNGIACVGGVSVQDCDEKKEILKKSLDEYDKKQQVTTNAAFDVISILANPDPNALKASKFFKFDEKFNFKNSSIYQFFGDPLPSKICLAKIDGYLDNEQNTGGGVTRYKFNRDVRNFGSPVETLNVLYDLRAQRTKMTPDGKSVISYSYFLRAPDNEELKYIIAISYVGDGQIKKLALTDMKTVSPSKTGNGFESVEIPLNSTTVDEYSFQIGLVAVGASKQPYYSTIAPIVLINAGDSYASISSGSGNSAGNVAAQGQAASSFGVNDMLGMMG